MANKLDSLDLRFRNEVYDTSVVIERQKALNLAKQYEVMNEDIARSVAGRSLTEDQRKEIQSRIWLNSRNAALAQIQAEYHGKLAQAQIDELVAKTDSLESTKKWLDERVKTEKASARLTDAKAELAKIDLHDLRNIPEKTRQITRSMKMIKDGLIYFLYICLMKRPVDTLARLIIAVIKAKVYIFVFLLIMFLGAELRQCIG